MCTCTQSPLQPPAPPGRCPGRPARLGRAGQLGSRAAHCCIPPEGAASLRGVQRGVLISNYTDMDAHPPAHGGPRVALRPQRPLRQLACIARAADGEAQQGLWLECDTLLLFCSGTSVNFPLPGSLSFPLGLPAASAQNLNLPAGWEVTEGDSSRGPGAPAGRACKGAAVRTPQSPENGRQRTGREGRGGGDWETGQRVEARARVRSPERGLAAAGWVAPPWVSTSPTVR